LGIGWAAEFPDHCALILVCFVRQHTPMKTTVIFCLLSLLSTAYVSQGQPAAARNLRIINNPPKARNLTDLVFAISPGQGTLTKSYRFYAIDVDGDAITYSGNGLPNGATIDSATGELRMQVSESDIGKTFSNISISISDGKATVSRTISISIHQPQKYYVAKAGSDSNPGTANLPWLTIKKSTGYVLPGDTVFISAGNYPERVATRSTANGSDYITYTNNADGTVEMRGFDINQDSVWIAGLSITNPGPNISGIKIDGNYPKITGNYIYNIGGNEAAGVTGYWYDRPFRAYIASNHIFKCQYGIWTYGFNWTVEHNNIDRPCQWNSNYDSDYIELMGEGHVFRYNYLHGGLSNELVSAHVDSFQTYDDANSKYWAANILIEHNFCSDFAEGFEGEATFLRRSHNIVFRNNIFFNGLPFKTGYPNGVSPIIVHDIPNVVVTNNTFYNIRYGPHWDPTTWGLATNAIIKNNIFYNQLYPYIYINGTADYNMGYQVQTSGYVLGPHDIYGVNPLFVNPSNPLGPDGIMWTADDGFQLQSGSRGRTAGENGVQVGAYGP